MTNSASQATRAPFEHSLGIIRQASIEILLLLGIHTTEGKEPGGSWNNLSRRVLTWRLGRSGEKIADK